MTTVSVTDFKAHCLQILGRMQDDPEEVLITKRGKVIAKVVPAREDGDASWRNLRGTAHFIEEDLLADDDVWEVLR